MEYNNYKSILLNCIMLKFDSDFLGSCKYIIYNIYGFEYVPIMHFTFITAPL